MRPPVSYLPLHFEHDSDHFQTNVRTMAITETSSTSAVKKMIIAAISTICYRRRVFPVDHYRDQKIDGFLFKMLSKNKKEAKDLCRWMEGDI